MILTDFLRIELNRGSPDHRIPKVLDHISMNLVTKVFDFGMQSRQYYRWGIIRISSFWFGIDSDKVKIFPHSINQLIKVPPKLTRNGHVMLNLIQNIQLIQSQCINLIQRVQTGNVLSVSFDDIDDVIFSSIAFQADVSIVNSVLFQNGFYRIISDSISVDHSWNGDTSLVLSLELNIGWAFV